MNQQNSDDKRIKRIQRYHEGFKAASHEARFNQKDFGIASLFQKLVRLAESDDHGNCQCYTCKKWSKWNQLQGGHYIKRANKAVIVDGLFSETAAPNVKPQCINCNKFLDGNPGQFRKYLVFDYGEKAVLELEALKVPKNHKWNLLMLATLKDDFKEEIKAHLRRIGK